MTVRDPVARTPYTIELVGGPLDGTTWRLAAHDVPCTGYVLHVTMNGAPTVAYRMTAPGAIPELRTATYEPTP